MSTEEFDFLVTASYGNGEFKPKYDDEMNIIRESQMRILERQKLALSQAQCQGECHS